MADTYGAATLPIAVTTPAGDPALAKVGAYLKAVVNPRMQAAWTAVWPRSGEAALPIKVVFTHDPRKRQFNDRDLPALYIFREDGEFSLPAADWRSEESRWKALWVLPSAAQDAAASIDPLWQAFAKACHEALVRGIDPLWVDAGETATLATSVAADTDSVALSMATLVAPVTLSGSSLNGVRGSATMAPRLQPTVTTTLVEAGSLDPGIPDAGDDGPGTTEVYNTSDPIVWTVVDWHGVTRAKQARLTLPMGGETLGPLEDVARVVSIAVPAQLSTLGTLSFGTGAFAGRGSDLRQRASLEALAARSWRRVEVNIEVLNDDLRVDRRLTYPALELSLTAQEKHDFDRTDASRFALIATPPAGLDLDVTTSDGLLVTRAEL